MVFKAFIQICSIVLFFPPANPNVDNAEIAVTVSSVFHSTYFRYMSAPYASIWPEEPIPPSKPSRNLFWIAAYLEHFPWVQLDLGVSRPVVGIHVKVYSGHTVWANGLAVTIGKFFFLLASSMP